MKLLVLLLIGLAAANADKIVGGDPANGPIPYQARIQYNSGSIRCGGTLVNANWIVSAAHCQGSAIQYGTWKIVLGAYSATATQQTESNRQTFNVAQQIVYEGYNSGTMEGDVMVMRLDGAAQPDSDVGYAYLAAESTSTASPGVGTDVTVSGWGTLQSNGDLAPELMEVVVQVYDQNQCNDDYRRYGGIHDDMICLAADGKDSCQGDSGGPAVIPHSDGTYELVGIVSWGVGCADPRYPGVYTRVSYYADWIKANMA